MSAKNETNKTSRTIEAELAEEILRGAVTFTSPAFSTSSAKEAAAKLAAEIMAAADSLDLVPDDVAARSTTCAERAAALKAEEAASKAKDKKIKSYESELLARAAADEMTIEAAADAITLARALRNDPPRLFADELAVARNRAREVLDGLTWDDGLLSPDSELRKTAAVRLLFSDPSALGLDVGVDETKVDRILALVDDGHVSTAGSLRVAAMKRYGSLEGEFIARLALARLEDADKGLPSTPETDAKADAFKAKIEADEEI